MATRTETRDRGAAPQTTRRQRKPPSRRPSLEREHERTDRTLRLFERLRSLAAHERERDAQSRTAAEAEELAWQQLQEADPIRISHAQRLLGVSNQTVRDWVSAGVLADAGGAPQRVALDSVVRAKLIADELREHGRDRDFMSVVLSRLEALALSRDEDFRESVRQMRAGERLPRPY